MRRAALTQLRETHHHRVDVALQPVHVKDNNGLQQRQPRTHFQGFVELLFVFNKENRAARVFAQVVHLRSRVGGVDAVGHTAGAKHTQIGNDPLHHRVGQDGGTVAWLKANRRQAHGHFAHGQGRFIPCPLAPDAQFFLTHPHLVAPRGDGVQEHGGQGVTRNDDVGAGLNV